MKSNELNNQTVAEFQNAIEAEDSKALAELQVAQYRNMENKVMTLFEELKNETDEKVLNARGVFKLTTDEKKFYDNLFKNAVGNSPTAGGTLLIPSTIITRVFDDLREDQSGILDLIDLVNTTGASEWLVSTA